MSSYIPKCPKCKALLERVVGRDATYHCTACDWPCRVRVRSEGNKLALETIEPEEEEE